MNYIPIKRLIVFLSISLFVLTSSAQKPAPPASSMVQKFYAINHQPFYWLTSEKDIRRATEWLDAIKSVEKQGYISIQPQTDLIRTVLLSKTTDFSMKERTDKQITELILNFLKNWQEGDISFRYDEVRSPRDSVYIHQLMNSKYKGAVSRIVSRLDCNDRDYQSLIKFMNDSIDIMDSLKYKKAILTMNYLRYVSINHQSEYVVVNIPAAEARYYRNNSLSIKMKTVVGKKSKPTPTIASYITNIITFPHWNVPHSIAVRELLPKVQKNENYLEQQNFEVVDANGNVVEDSELNWKDYSENNFPYFFRQSTGSGNALGVLKFNFQNPYSIFLHATSWQGVFSKDYRFLSHGCVRMEKPFELAGAMLRGQIDIKKLKSGKKNTESKSIKLPHKVPVFIVYMPVKVDGKKVTFLNDVYSQIK